MFPTTSVNNRNLAGAGNKAEQLQHISLADGVDNTLIGINAGTMSANRGSKNTNVGANAGANAGSLDSCTLVGTGTGNLATYSSNTVGVGALGLEQCFAVYDSVAIGSEAGRVLSQTKETTLVGYRAGAQLQSATQTTAVGSYAAYRGSNMIASTFVGSGAAEDARAVIGCVAVGAGSAANIRDASNNVAVGAFSAAMATGNNDTYVGFSCASNAFGSNNVFVGCSAGAFATVDDSIIIGANAGRNATGSNVVIIGGGGGGGGASGNGSTILGAGAGANSSGDYMTDIGYNAGRNWIGNAVTFVGAQAGETTGIGDFATGVGMSSLTGGARGDTLTAVGSLSGAGYVGSNTSIVGFGAGVFGKGDRNQIFGSALKLEGNDNVLIGSLAPGVTARAGNVVAVGSRLEFGDSLIDSVIIGKNVDASEVTSNVILIGSDFSALPTDDESVVIALGGERAFAANSSTLTMGPTDGEYFVGNDTCVKLTVVSGNTILPTPPTHLTASTCTLAPAPIPNVIGNTYGGGTYVSSASSSIGAAPWQPFGQSQYDVVGNAWRSAILYDAATGAYAGSENTTVSNGVSTSAVPGEWIQVQLPSPQELNWANYAYVTPSTGGTSNVIVVGSNSGSSLATWDLVAGNSWIYDGISTTVATASTNDISSRKTYSNFRYILTSTTRAGSGSTGANILTINIGARVKFTNPSTYLSDTLTTLGGPSNRAASFTPESTLLGPIGVPWVTANSAGIHTRGLNSSTNISVGGYTGQPNLLCVYGDNQDPTSNVAICGLGMESNAMRYNGFGHKWHNTFGGDLVTMALDSQGSLDTALRVYSPTIWAGKNVMAGDGINGDYPNLVCLYGSGGDRFDPFATKGTMGIGLGTNTMRFNGANFAWHNTLVASPFAAMELEAFGTLYVKNGLNVSGGVSYARTSQRLSTATGTATWSSVDMTGVSIGVYSTNGMYTGGNYWAASDRRKKFEIATEDPAECADAVRAARLVTYATKDASGRHLGFIAQEAAEAAPGCVTLVRDVVPSVLEFVSVVGGRTFEVEGAGGIFSGEHVCGVRFEVGGKTVDANVASVSGNAVTVEADIGAERAFVVGPIVDDFHALDYHHMWAKAFGAVQHLLKERDALEDRVKRIEALLGL